jgi:5-methylcytosine-specific restriction enzyme subunit McrC
VTSDPRIILALQEWEHHSPDTDEALRSVFLDEARDVRTLAELLTASQKIEVLELKRGLGIQTRAHVGRIELGRISITIRPKIDRLQLLPLLRYAYGLRNFELYGRTAYPAEASGLQDLLLLQFAAETAELVARGLHRRYDRREGHLTTPQGRIDFRGLAFRPVPSTTLPCIHHPRTENCALNRTLLAGLRLGVRLADDLPLRGRLRGLAALLDDCVDAVPLHPALLRQAARENSRLTAAYRPALALIEILAQSGGTTLDVEDQQLRLPGFLFDMNRFYQQLLSRLLNDSLPGYTVRDESRLSDMFAYMPGFNPRARRPPTPRPDFVILRGSRPIAVLDAKYRDLWNKDLPREMLYQLTLYSMSQGGGGVATILYPTTQSAAREARIEFRNPLSPGGKCQVVLRPVDMPRLAGLIEGGRVRLDERLQYVRQLALGKGSDGEQ